MARGLLDQCHSAAANTAVHRSSHSLSHVRRHLTGSSAFFLLRYDGQPACTGPIVTLNQVDLQANEPLILTRSAPHMFAARPRQQEGCKGAQARGKNCRESDLLSLKAPAGLLFFFCCQNRCSHPRRSTHTHTCSRTPPGPGSHQERRELGSANALFVFGLFSAWQNQREVINQR